MEAIGLTRTENATWNSEDISDEGVVSRVLAGERDLFEIIMRRYNQRLYRVARSILRNEAEVEDVVQDAYVRAYTHLAQYAGEAKFSTWLTRIAVNEALRRLRKQGRSDDMQRMALTTPLSAEGPDRYVSDREVLKIMESAIERLPSAYRSVVMLRDVEDLSTAEAADCLGIPPATVKTRLHRGHALLRETLGPTLGATRPEPSDRESAGRQRQHRIRHPINLARWVADQLRRAWKGRRGLDRAHDPGRHSPAGPLAGDLHRRGAFVADVTTEGPAAKAGIERSRVITSWGLPTRHQLA